MNAQIMIIGLYGTPAEVWHHTYTPSSEARMRYPVGVRALRDSLGVPRVGARPDQVAALTTSLHKEAHKWLTAGYGVSVLLDAQPSRDELVWLATVGRQLGARVMAHGCDAAKSAGLEEWTRADYAREELSRACQSYWRARPCEGVPIDAEAERREEVRMDWTASDLARAVILAQREGVEVPRSIMCRVQPVAA